MVKIIQREDEQNQGKKEEVNKVRIAVVIEGGNVQNIMADGPCEIVVIDYDVNETDEEVTEIYDQKAAVRSDDIEINVKEIDYIYSVKEDTKNE